MERSPSGTKKGEEEYSKEPGQAPAEEEEEALRRRSDATRHSTNLVIYIFSEAIA